MPAEAILAHSDLVYDVGLHHGEDTEFYLAQGFRVLAIDADPHLVDECRARFAREIEAGRLHILNVGISERSSVEKFWICESNSAWNSFYQSLAGRNGCPHHSIDIRTRRFDDIIREFGIPAYLKIDIEGTDTLCIEALQGMPVPKYISAEDGGPDPNGAPRTLGLMRAAGYRYFSLVSQLDFRPLFRRWHRSYRPNLAIRAITSAAYGRLRLPGLSKIAESFSYRKALSRRNGGWSFRYGCSGPWGAGIRGGWVEFEEASRLYQQIRSRYLARGGDAMSFWCDWHATVETPPRRR